MIATCQVGKFKKHLNAMYLEEGLFPQVRCGHHLHYRFRPVLWCPSWKIPLPFSLALFSGYQTGLHP
jgi:hypothetical protein